MKNNIACLSLAIVLGLNSSAWSANRTILSPLTFGAKNGGIAMREMLRLERLPHTEVFASLKSMGFKFPQKLDNAALELSNLKRLRTNALIDQKQYEVQSEVYLNKIDQSLDDAKISRFLIAKMKKFADDAASEQTTRTQLKANRKSMEEMTRYVLVAYLPQSKMSMETFTSIYEKTGTRWLALFRTETSDPATRDPLAPVSAVSEKPVASGKAIPLARAKTEKQ